MLFDVQTIDLPPWQVVAVVGDIDLATLPTLSGHLAVSSAESLALDLSGVDHFDPLCFGVVVAASLKAKRRGTRFAVVCPPGRPRELLAEMSIDTVIDVLERREDLS